MKKFLKYIYVSIFLIIVISVIAPFFSSAQTTSTLEYPEFMEEGNPASFIENFYAYALGISGTLAVIMIVYGGVKYIASAGNTSVQAEAKDIIKSSVYGILLLGGAVLILNTINPQITSLEVPNLKEMPSVNEQINQDAGGN